MLHGGDVLLSRDTRPCFLNVLLNKMYCTAGDLGNGRKKRDRAVEKVKRGAACYWYYWNIRDFRPKYKHLING